MGGLRWRLGEQVQGEPGRAPPTHPLQAWESAVPYDRWGLHGPSLIQLI